MPSSEPCSVGIDILITGRYAETIHEKAITNSEIGGRNVDLFFL